MLAHGGLDAMVQRTSASSAHLYDWAERHASATPFVTDPAKRSLVVGTIENPLCPILMGNRLKLQGVDVVIGFVETHGRAETAALVEGLEHMQRGDFTGPRIRSLWDGPLAPRRG